MDSRESLVLHSPTSFPSGEEGRRTPRDRKVAIRKPRANDWRTRIKMALLLTPLRLTEGDRAEPVRRRDPDPAEESCRIATRSCRRPEIYRDASLAGVLEGGAATP